MRRAPVGKGTDSTYARFSLRAQGEEYAAAAGLLRSADGVPLGSSTRLPIRAARVSALIWIVMVAGALVLFGMIGYRLPGQIRQRRAELAASEAAPVTEAEPELESTTAERP